MATLGIRFAFCIIFLAFTNLAFSKNTCKSMTPTFGNMKIFENCIDLNTLNAILHYTYEPTESTFSMAFTAALPSHSTYRYIAFALNPTHLAMRGAQALVAYTTDTHHPIYVEKMNIVSYTNFTFGSISYNVTGLSAQKFDDKVTIFATWTIPTTGNMGSINLLWQVGVGRPGNPAMHELRPENLRSLMQLNLLANAPPIGAPEPSRAPPPSPAPVASRNDSSGPAPVEPKQSGSAPQSVVSMVLVYAAIMACFL